VTTAVRPSRIRLRWLVVVVPAVIVAVLEQVSDTLLDQQLPFPLDNLLITGAVLIIGTLFAAVAFRRIDALTGVLRARNEELEARGAEARALHRVSVAIATLTDVDHVLQAVVTHARELLGADVAVLLLEGDDGHLDLRAASGLRAPAGPRGAAPADPDTGSGADAMLSFVDPGMAAARLSAPLQRGGQTIGLLAVGSATVRGFDVDDVETLASLANQATIALEHARLESRLRELAVVDERERIARELHDGIAQVLGYVNTKSQAVDGFLEAGRIDEARVQLDELGSAARAVYVDVRETILGLRGPIEPGQGLGSALASHARRVAEASRFVLEVAVDPASAGLRLDPDAEAHVYRIVQEALTNVRKHAVASRVRLGVRVAGNLLLVTIDDDGRGLGAAGVAREMPGYGLRSMRERASRIGATVGVTNRPGGGVSVRLAMPLAGHGRVEPDKVAVGSGTGDTA
jgi:signal transduction histidine kinase